MRSTEHIAQLRSKSNGGTTSDWTDLCVYQAGDLVSANDAITKSKAAAPYITQGMGEFQYRIVVRTTTTKERVFKDNC